MPLTFEGTANPEVTDGLIERISVLDLSAVEVSLQAEGMQAERVDWAVGSYRQFLTIAALFPETEFAPSKDTDIAWHAHIDSANYDDDIVSVFGERPFVHNAGLGERPEELPRLLEAWENTLSATRYVFGETSLFETTSEDTQPAYCGGGGGRDIAPAACSKCVGDLVPAACSSVPPEARLGELSLLGASII